MGGKQKQAQRTKNNARPSSSSRSAEILGTNIPGFVGFSANRDGGYNTVLPGFSSVENFDANIDPNIQIVFKKMGKKDPVTKLKALNEFTAYINSVEEEVICGTLSFWPRMYCQLSADCNHRVREVTQIAHSALVAKCGRSIAPYLKQLVPVWLTSQYDTYMPAKVQAKEAFDKVFPPKKVPEVMTFCRNEIFDYISDNLILHTATTLSNPKLFTPEECESIYERTVVMSLQGYEFFLNNLPDEHLEWLYERQVKILDNKKFWELRNQKSSLIKSRLYAVIGCLCRRLTKWFTPKYGKKACELLFSQLSEKDFELLVSIWENMILLMAYVPNWGEYVDIENVLVHIFNVLSDGGRNCATGIGPLLLPLLVHLSSMKKENITDFYSKFLNSICIGLEQRWVMSSKSGCNAWLSGLVECLIHISNIDTETDINSQVLSQSIRSWLKTAVEPKTFSSSFNFVKLNAAHLTDVSILWTKNSLMDNGAKSNTFSHLIRIFWQNFLFVITSQIDNMTVDDSEIKKVTDLHLELLMGLKNASNNKKKLTSHVKFTIDHIVNDQNNVSDEKIEPIENVDVMQHFQQSLNKSTHEICARYILYAKIKNISAPILNPLHSIVREFDSPQLHCCMSQAITKDSTAKGMKLYTDWYSNWLKSDSMRSQAVVDLSFSLLVHLVYEDQMVMLKSFNQLSLPVIKWCISRCISHPYSSNKAVCEWLLSNTVHESLIALSKLVVTHGDKRHVELLKMCFAHTDGGNILISKNTCSSIINIFEDSLYNIDSDHLNICAAFSSHLAAAISSNMNDSEDYTKLLLSLFTLNVDTQNNTDVLLEDISMEVNSSWRDALLTLSDENINLFIKKSSIIILNKLLKSNELNIATINTLVNISLNLIDSSKCIDVSNDKNSNYSYDVMITLLKIDYDEVKPAIDKIMLLALVTDIINGKLYCSSSDSPMMKEFTHDTKNIRIADLNACELNKILSWLLFSMKIVESVMNSKNDYENLNVIDKPDGSDIVLNVLHYIAAIKTLYVEYKAWNWYNDMAKLFDPLMTSTINTINNLTDKNYQTLYDSVKKKFQQEGFYWTICLYMCEHNLRISKSITCHGSEVDVILNNLIEKLDVDNFDELLSIEFYHNLQVLKNEGHIKENDDLDMKVACVLAMRSIYLTHFANKPKVGDIHFELEEFKSGITLPLISLTTIMDIYYVHKEMMLYDEDISSVDWDAVNCNTSIVRFLTTCINICGWELESHHWDFITISVSSYIQSIDKSKKGWDSPKVALLGTAVFELYCSVSKFISSILPESISREPTKALLQLLDEWRDLFAPDMHHHIFEVFMSIFKDCTAPEKTISPLSILFITSLHDVMQSFQWIHIKNKYSENILIDSFNVCLNIMASPSHHILKYMAGTILKGMTPLMIEYDKLQGDKSNTATEENPQIEPVPVHLSVHIIEPTLINIQGCMDAVLNPYKVGEDNCILLPYTDGHSIALGYLFLWEVLLDIAQESTAYLQHEYSEFFKEGQYVEQLLNVLFRLLPAELSEQSKFLNYFKVQPVLSYKEPINWDLVSRLACHRLLRCLHGGWLGVFVRGWWGSLPTRSSQHVERIVQSHVSPLLIASQLSGVSKQQNSIPNIELNIHPSVNEVVCIYVIEDLKMGLTIQLCKNHPLNKPRVISSGTPINNMTWLSMYLSHQNGSVYQAIKMWANAVQKKIESTPVCYVCYCRLHPTTGQLPKMLCQTCKNKFHNVCLYRWFSTSGKTTCPMCRNLFNV